MRDIEQYISPLVESQFPALYREDGPFFVLFVKEYYKWLEEANNTLGQSRSLFTTRDIDRTADEFLIYFKEKYLKGVDINSYSSKRKLVKAALDLFRSKGTERSIDLLFKLVYGVNIHVYSPGDDILRPSDGTWVVPVYLELSRSAKTPNLAGKQITGSKSQASAFVEYVITRNIKNKIVDLIFLSNVTGDFSIGDIITTDGIVEGAPKVIGSLSTIDVVSSGEGFIVGETVQLISSKGVEGKARVASIFEASGLVSFELIDGGWGYSVYANTNVSQKVATLIGITNSNTSITGFEVFETVTQNLDSFAVNNVIGDFSVGNIIADESGSYGIVVKADQASGANTANLVINTINGDILSTNTVLVLSNSVHIATNTQVAFAAGDVVRQGSIYGTVDTVSNAYILAINTASISTNGMHVGTYVQQDSSGATGYIELIPGNFGHVFTNVATVALSNTSGTFDNTSKLMIYTDSTKATYVANATPTSATRGYVYNIKDTTSPWASGSVVYKNIAPAVNTNVVIAAKNYGYYTDRVSKVATGVMIGQNTAAIGLLSISNTFYACNTSVLYGLSSNTYANVVSLSTGVHADFNIGVIENYETVFLSPDRIAANNDGPGSANVPFSSMLISGANSSYGNAGIHYVYVFNGGTGYSNTNKVVFSGGNTGAGSFTAGNATITTDTSGTILTVTLGANTGNGFATTPSVSVVNSSGGSTGVGSGANVEPLFSYGFPKLTIGDASYALIDLLRFESRTIGTIATLTNINPGENYNTKPFVHIIDEYVAGYGKQDFIMTITNVSGSSPTFNTGEMVYQVIDTSSKTITSNTFTGNTSGAYDVNEIVQFYNGASVVGTGQVYSTTKDTLTNIYTTVLINTTGTVSSGNFMVGKTTHGNTTISNVATTTTSAYARGRVRSANTTEVSLKRESLFTEFTTGGTAVGSSSGVTADIVSVIPDTTRRVAGDNANVITNVVSSNGAISALKVIDSGVGYEQDVEIAITSEDGTRVASGKANLIKQGQGEGYYSSTRGFLDDDKKIFDGYYYQDYSYEVQATIPFEKYDALLKEFLHVSGTKLFGRVVSYTPVNNQITTTSSVIIS